MSSSMKQRRPGNLVTSGQVSPIWQPCPPSSGKHSLHSQWSWKQSQRPSFLSWTLVIFLHAPPDLPGLETLHTSLSALSRSLCRFLEKTRSLDMAWIQVFTSPFLQELLLKVWSRIHPYWLGSPIVLIWGNGGTVFIPESKFLLLKSIMRLT